MPNELWISDSFNTILSRFRKSCSFRLPRRSLEIQTQVLRELTSPASFQWNVRESYAKIAKKLGMDEETVRLAVRRAKDSGFVERWRIILNPNLLGQKAGAIQLEVTNLASKSETISQLKLIDGVVLIFDFHGKGLRVVFNYETDQALERKLKLVRSICRCEEEQSIWWITSSPPCSVKVRNVDWHILKSISRDPRRNLRDVANEVGVSNRTVNRRLGAMIAGKMFYLIPVRNVKKSSGLLCNFVIRYQENSRRQIEELFGPLREWIDFNYYEKGLYNVSLMLDNITAADELTESLSGVKGLIDVRMNIIKDFIYVDDWLDDIIQGKIGKHPA
jgi:DNA-binding Lrp family transcriptional regulator